MFTIFEDKNDLKMTEKEKKKLEEIKKENAEEEEEEEEVDEDFDKIKLMKIEYLNKKIDCVKASSNFKEMKKCWKKRKKKKL